MAAVLCVKSRISRHYLLCDVVSVVMSPRAPSSPQLLPLPICHVCDRRIGLRLIDGAGHRGHERVNLTSPSRVYSVSHCCWQLAQIVCHEVPHRWQRASQYRLLGFRIGFCTATFWNGATVFLFVACQDPLTAWIPVVRQDS